LARPQGEAGRIHRKGEVIASGRDRAHRLDIADPELVGEDATVAAASYPADGDALVSSAMTRTVDEPS